jgi:hypothetical protein
MTSLEELPPLEAPVAERLFAEADDDVVDDEVRAAAPVGEPAQGPAETD